MSMLLWRQLNTLFNLLSFFYCKVFLVLVWHLLPQKHLLLNVLNVTVRAIDHFLLLLSLVDVFKVNIHLIEVELLKYIEISLRIEFICRALAHLVGATLIAALWGLYGILRCWSISRCFDDWNLVGLVFNFEIVLFLLVLAKSIIIGYMRLIFRFLRGVLTVL